MIVENPYSNIHYLTQYFPIRPSMIDGDRTKNGDHFKKPTQYWFLNCEPEQNVVFEPIDYVEQKHIEKVGKMENGCSTKVMRSMIHTQYAERFIKQFVLDAEGGVWTARGGVS